jgi:hypothetical protein
MFEFITIKIAFIISGLVTLSSSLQQRKLPLRSLNLQSCSITHKSLHAFHTALIANSYILKNLQILNLSGNRVKDENVSDELKRIRSNFQMYI